MSKLLSIEAILQTFARAIKKLVPMKNIYFATFFSHNFKYSSVLA